ncbi:hypothetical protein BBJ28_00022532, partial [Nothophytophthora sp. Chile5]
LNPSTNNVTVGNELFPIRSNASPDEHTLYVWDSIISRAQARNVYVLAYSFGAKSVLTLIQKREAQVVQRVNALVFAEGAYRLDPATTPPSVGQFLRQRAINFKGDGQIPVGGHVPAAEEQLSCCCLSVGDLTTSAPTADGRPPSSASAPASALSKRSSSNKARTISLSLETTFTYFVAARDRGCSAAQFISESETKTRSTEANMDFARARAELSERLRADASRGSQGHANEEPDYSPVVVFESICHQDFRRWLDQHEGELRRWHYEPLTADSGRVVVYSSTIAMHARVGSGIVIKVVRQIVEAGKSIDLIATVRMERAPTIDVGDRDQEPDGAITPSDADANAFPTFVVEVAGFHESWPLLEEILERWMAPNTTVQVALGVKFDATDRRIVLLQRDGLKVTRNVVDFAVEQPDRVAFPLRALYYGVELPELLAGHEDDLIQIDLTWLRGVIDQFL